MDWTFSEIARSESSSILKILRRHIDLDALAKGHICQPSPLQVAPSHGNSRSGNSEGQAVSSAGMSDPLPAIRQQGITRLPPAHPEAGPEAYTSHEELQHYGWGSPLNLDLIPAGIADDIFPFGVEGNQSISWEDQIQDIYQFGLEGNQSISWEDQIPDLLEHDLNTP